MPKPRPNPVHEAAFVEAARLVLVEALAAPGANPSAFAATHVQATTGQSEGEAYKRDVDKLRKKLKRYQEGQAPDVEEVRAVLESNGMGDEEWATRMGRQIGVVMREACRGVKREDLPGDGPQHHPLGYVGTSLEAEPEPVFAWIHTYEGRDVYGYVAPSFHPRKLGEPPRVPYTVPSSPAGVGG